MKVACDVKGTLEGPKKAQVLEILKIFEGNGASITVWSNLYSYAVEFIKDNKLEEWAADSKWTKGDLGFDETKYFDIAIEDDRSQSYLPVKKFIWVDEIPDEVEEVKNWLEKEFASYFKGDD